MDSPTGRQTLASSAPPDLFQRRRRSHSLHLAGEGRFAQTSAVRVCAGGPAHLPVSRIFRLEKRSSQRNRGLDEDGSVGELSCLSDVGRVGRKPEKLILTD